MQHLSCRIIDQARFTEMNLSHIEAHLLPSETLQLDFRTDWLELRNRSFPQNQ